MLVIGLTGGIGSGKSTVAALFEQLGVTIIDSDIIAREVVAPGTELLAKIAAHFGNHIIDHQGNLNRRELRNLIFTHEQERRWLEQHLHPAIYARIREQLQSVQTSYCVVIIPLLIETNPHNLVDRILVIDCPEELQISRSQKRDQSNAENIKEIMQTQVQRTDRLAAADDVINNSGDLASLEKQVKKLHQHYLRLSKERTVD